MDYVQLPQTIQAIQFCSRITFQDKWNCKNNLLSHLLPLSGFSTLHISAYSDVVLIFSYTLFHFCFAFACSFTMAVPLVFYGRLGYPNHFLDQLEIRASDSAKSRAIVKKSTKFYKNSHQLKKNLQCHLLSQLKI